MWPAETQNLFACWNKDERINSEGVWKHVYRYFSKKWWKLGLGIQISQIQWTTIKKIQLRNTGLEKECIWLLAKHLMNPSII